MLRLQLKCIFAQICTMDFREIAIKEIITVSFTLFAVIDMLGTIPVLASLREKMGGVIKSTQATLVSGGLMILFLFGGQQFLSLLGLDVKSFAVAGSIAVTRDVEDFGTSGTGANLVLGAAIESPGSGGARINRARLKDTKSVQGQRSTGILGVQTQSRHLDILLANIIEKIRIS